LGIAVAANFYASVQAQRRQLHAEVHDPHWRMEAAVDFIAGGVLAMAAVVLLAVLLR
jgi:hypothetical protein